MSRRPVFLWLLWVSLLCCGMAVAQTPRLHWLGTFGGGYSLGRSISADGTTVVGWFGGSYASDQRAALWKVGERPVAIPHLGGGESQAYDISADGNIVVGYSRDSRGNWRAFRWTPATGTQPLDTANRDSSAHGVNANGSMIVGEMRAFQIGSPSRAFRWTAETGMQDIHTLTDPRQSFATDVSADGRVIVGACITPTNRYRAFRWTAETGMQLIHPVGSDESIARGIAADGNTIVGYYIDARGDYRACYWGANGLLQEVPVPSDYRYSVAWGASADGSVIVGEVRTTISTERRAFRWNRSSGVFELIGDFGGGQSVAYGVSDDGQTICGAATAPDRSRLAFRWRAETGLVNLGSLSANSSVAYDVSADGRVVVGICSNTAGGERAFMWTLDAGLHPLAATPANIRHGAYGISADGSAIVGYSEWRNSYNTLQIGPTLWTNSSSYLLTGIDSEGEALKISANGEVVIGWLRGTRGYNRPFRWKASEGAINLAPPQWDSQNINIRAHVVDARGESVAGIITIITTQMFRWTVQSGFEVIPSPAEYPNAYPRGISADGRLVVGSPSAGEHRPDTRGEECLREGFRLAVRSAGREHDDRPPPPGIGLERSEQPQGRPAGEREPHAEPREREPGGGRRRGRPHVRREPLEQPPDEPVGGMRDVRPSPGEHAVRGERERDPRRDPRGPEQPRARVQAPRCRKVSSESQRPTRCPLSQTVPARFLPRSETASGGRQLAEGVTCAGRVDRTHSV